MPVSLYKLISEDGAIIMAERAAIKHSKFIKDKLAAEKVTDQNCKDMTPISIPCHSFYLKMVIKWLDHHKQTLPKRVKLRYSGFSRWDKDFFTMDNGHLFGLLMAVNTLGIDDLKDMGCCAVAELIRGKSTEEIRRIYGIKSDEEVMEERLANGGEGTSTTTFTVDYS